jgi:hypothetical protein
MVNTAECYCIGTSYDRQINRMEHCAVYFSILILLTIPDFLSEVHNNKKSIYNTDRISNISLRLAIITGMLFTFLSHTRQILGSYLKTGHDQLLPSSLYFPIHSNSNIIIYIVDKRRYTTKISVVTKSDLKLYSLCRF